MENAELYSSANGMQKKDANEILAEFKDKMKWTNDARILDIGCGSGEVTTEILLPRLPKDFRELVGLDVSLEMIQHARNLHSHPKLSFIQFDIAQNSENLLDELTKMVSSSKSEEIDLDKLSRQSQNIKILLNNRKILDCQALKLYDGKSAGYDVICSFYCLHWIPNQRLALKNIYKLLKPGGESLLVFLAKSPIFTLYRKLSTLSPWKDYMQDVDCFIPFYQDSNHPLENFKEILAATGFDPLTADCRERNYTFDSFTSLRTGFVSAMAMSTAVEVDGTLANKFNMTKCKNPVLNVFNLKCAITAVNPFLSRIPDNLQDDFVSECLRQTESLKLAEFVNNCYRVSYKLIVAHIKKPLK